MRDRGLQGIEAVVHRQQGMLAEGDDRSLLLGRQHLGANDLAVLGSAEPGLDSLAAGQAHAGGVAILG